MAVFLGPSGLLDNDYYRVKVTLHHRGGENVSVEGNTQEGLALQTSGNYGSSDNIENAIGAVHGGLGRIIQTGRDVVSHATKNLEGRDIVSVWESTQVWNGYSGLSFRIPLTFVCMSTMGADADKQDVRNKVNKLMQGIMPSIGTFKLASVFNPPLGYIRDDTSAGKITLQIGNWFKADKLIMESCNFTYSKSVNRLGQPLYANGEITLKPYRSLSYEEYLRFFL